MDTLIRCVKGLYMTLAFGLFGLGILLSLLFVVPFCSIVFRGRARTNATRKAIGALLRVWLAFVAFGGLVALRCVKGKPLAGPCLMVSNHPGLFDIIFLICCISDLSVLVKPSLVTLLPLGPIFRCLDYVVGADGRDSTTLGTIFGLRTRLEKGWRVLLFPEGTRSPKGSVGPFRAGAFRLARIANVPIQPVFVRNAPPFLPHEDPWYFPLRSTSAVELEFWPPLAPIQVGQEREVADRLQREFLQALGSEPTDTLLISNE